MPDLPTYEDSLHRSLRDVDPLAELEDIGLDAADGRVLAESIVADRDQPPFDRSAMDGYAIRSADLSEDAAYPVVGTIAAGRPASVDVPPGSCVAIATGAVVPSPLDLVVPHERSDRCDPVRLDADGLAAGYAIHPRGADATEGSELVRAGERLSPVHLALAATVGLDHVRVRRQPRIRVLTSGDEIVAPDVDPLAHQVRNGNAPMLQSLVERIGARWLGHAHVLDDPDLVRATLEHAIDDADVVVTAGGISAGDRDFLPDTIDALGGETRVAGAAIQPGKPVRIQRLPSGVMIVSLPGNPVSVLATACLYLWPLVRTMLGRTAPLPWRPVELAADVRPNPKRQLFRPARIDATGMATVPAWQGSGDLSHAASTDGLVALPRQSDPVSAGRPVPFLPWP